MKTKLILVCGAIAGLILWGCEKAAPDDGRKVEYWTCSMHPQVHESKPGRCPFCGMELVPVYAGSTKHKEETETPKADSGGDGVQLTQAEIHQTGVRIERAEKRKLNKDLLIFGTLGYDLNRHRDVVPLVSGRVEKQFIDFNQTEVRKGEPLVSLYSPEALQLQEDYLKALRDRWLSTFYERELLTSVIRLAGEKLLRIGFTQKDLDRLEDEKSPTGDVVVRSPITGTVVGNMINIGEFVEANQALYHIAPIDELWFNAQVFEPDIGLLKLGERVRITVKSHPGLEFIGKLVFVDRSLDVANRTVSVRFVVPNKHHRLLPNLSASGMLEIPLGDVLSVPNSAVLDLGTRHVVYIQQSPGVYDPKNVRIGQVTRQYTQILEGVEEGAEVVTAGAFLIDAQRQLKSGSAPIHDHVAQPEEPLTPPMPSSGGHQH